MVLRCGVAVAVAHLSANLCQYIACNPERFSSDEVLRLIFCLPFQNLSRLAVSVSACFCIVPSSDTSSSDSDFDSSLSSHGYDSHSHSD
ncbi:hypothetical protein SAY87_027290 [Trapa incisa]|uniref:Uncharacterized protein n=1 Tax=Trapa incisa TaxID=236973 RepID=A0AAN7JES0_9MYRT|nr:hypothetical protein SAY87_027290 [Trapa incisa]